MEHIVTDKTSLRNQLRSLKTERAMYETPYKKNYILSQLKDTICDIVRDGIYIWSLSTVAASILTNQLEITTTALLSILIASGFHLSDYLGTIAPTILEKKPTQEELSEMDNSINELGRQITLTSDKK